MRVAVRDRDGRRDLERRERIARAAKLAMGGFTAQPAVQPTAELADGAVEHRMLAERASGGVRPARARLVPPRARMGDMRARAVQRADRRDVVEHAVAVEVGVQPRRG